MSGEAVAAELLVSAQRHAPWDEAERRHQLTMVDWLRGASAPFDRNVFDPGHATGSCMVLSSAGRAAMIFHKNLKLWVQPGGHADPGETTSSEVAAREAEEELGVSIVAGGALELFDLDVHRIAKRGETPAHNHYDFRHLAVIDECELSPASDAAEARWVTRSEIAALGVDVGLKRMADKAVARGLLRER